MDRDELEQARELYLEEQEFDAPSPQVKFRYAVALVKSEKQDHKRRGLGLLEDLLEQGYEPVDTLYWTASTEFSVGDYRSSRRHCERLLRLDPNHLKAQALHKRLKEMAATDNAVGIGIFSAVVVAGVALKMILKR